MPQIGPLEIMLVAVIALIVFGPQRLPEIARSLGKGIAEFRRHASDIKSEFESGFGDGSEQTAPEDEKPAPHAVEGDALARPETGHEDPPGAAPSQP